MAIHFPDQWTVELMGDFLTAKLATVLTEAMNTTSDASHSEKSEKTAVDLLWLVLGPIILLGGMCGNVLVLVVMSQRNM